MSGEAVEQKKRDLMLLSLARFFYKDKATSLLNRVLDTTAPVPTSPLLDDPKGVIGFNSSFVQKIHYSWIADIMPQFPKLVQDSILQTINPALADKVASLLSIKVSKSEGTELVKDFGIFQLIKAFKLEERIPIPFLPDSPLNSLLGWEKGDLVTLIDLLPIPQLAPQIKKIVDRNRLIALYGALTAQQQKYLKLCMHQRTHVIEVDIDLRSWNLDKTELKNRLHKVGLQQFISALSGQDKDFLWYMAHILDKGRGTLLLENVKSKRNDQNMLYLFHATKFLTQSFAS